MSETSGLEATVTHKIGPMPGWAWVAIVAGCAWVYYMWKRNSAVSATGTVQQTADTSSTTTGVGWGGDGTVPTLSAPGNVVTANGTPGSTTNAQWARNVVNALIAGGADPSLANNSLTTYLSGGTLSAAQQSIVDTALTQYGAPPEGLISMNTTPTVPTSQYQGAGHLYTIQAGDTLQSIIHKFYGSDLSAAQLNTTARILTDQNPGAASWSQAQGNWNVTPGSQIYLGPNGIVGVQGNTLNTYDTGHTLPGNMAPKNATVI